MLQVGEVQQPPPALEGGVAPLQVLHQGEEPPDRRSHRPQVGQKLLAAVGKPLRQLSNPLFAHLPEALDPLLGGGVLAASHRSQPRKGDGGPLRRLVPPLAQSLLKCPQIGQSLRDAGGVAPAELFVPPAQRQGLFHPSRPVADLLRRLGQQQTAPDRLPGVGHLRQLKGFRLRRQPGAGVRVALYFMVDVYGDLHQTAVIPSGGHGIQEPGKVPLRLDAGIPLLQHLIHGLEGQRTRLALIA